MKTGAHSDLQRTPKKLIDAAWKDTDNYAREKHGDDYAEIKGFSRCGAALDDCYIINSEGEVLYDVFTIQNDLDGFESLYRKIKSVARDLSKTKVGLEATVHYSYNLLGFLLDKGLPTYVINPLHTNLYRKSLTLRKTKNDKVDVRTIASM